MAKNVVVGIAGSHRSLINSREFLNIIDKSNDFDKLYEIIYKLGGDKKISNSEALLLAALYGVKEMGTDFDHILLSDFFLKHKKRENQVKALMEIVKRSSGFLISSPVYFGDRSSLIAEWLSLFKIKNDDNLALDNKAAGIVSVGAKRNGGQETTNIFALFDCMNLGACVVGNGPPTSQYGGTAIGGAMGAIIDDTFGLNTSRGTGQRVGLLSKILALDPPKYRLKDKTRILFLVTRKDKHGKFLNKLKKLTFSESVETEILDITQKHISHCRACPVCPMGPLDKKYTCIIRPSSKKDEMKSIHKSMINADAIVLAHYNGHDAGPDKYQVFMERTRFIRRNNFELANLIFSTFYETEYTSDIFILRSMASFLRHNMFLAGPFYNAYRNNQQLIENIDMDLYSKHLEIAAKKAKLARMMGYNSSETSYLPIGYLQKDKK